MKQLGTLLLALACLALFVRADGTQRDRLEGARARWESLGAQEQALLQERWQRFQSLPADRQARLRARRGSGPARAPDALPAPARARCGSSRRPSARILSGSSRTRRADRRADAGLLPPEVVRRLGRPGPRIARAYSPTTSSSSAGA
jgi:hypothetical protein